MKADVIANGTGFYEALRTGYLLAISDRATWISPPSGRILLDAGFEGWCTVEQDCDPTLDVSPIDDALRQPRLSALHRLLRGTPWDD